MTGSFPKVGAWAWSFVGFVVATIIVVVALAAVSEIVLPLTFAAVLAVVFKPLVGKLQRRGLKPSLAAGLVVLGLLGLMARGRGRNRRGAWSTRRTRSAPRSTRRWTTAADELGIDQASLDDARAATEETAPAVAEGFLTKVGLGRRRTRRARRRPDPRRADHVLPAQGRHPPAPLRRRAGRLRLSATRSTTSSATPAGSSANTGGAERSCPRSSRWSSASPRLLLGLPLVFTIVVVNFIGGYIPYIGAFLGGGLAVIVALGDGGLGVAAVMLVDRARSRTCCSRTSWSPR